MRPGSRNKFAKPWEKFTHPSQARPGQELTAVTTVPTRTRSRGVARIRKGGCFGVDPTAAGGLGSGGKASAAEGTGIWWAEPLALENFAFFFAKKV